MSGDLIIRFVLGHLVGDFVLQNLWMALNKKEQLFPCIVHCLVYTVSVCVFTYPEIFAKDFINIFLIVNFVLLSHIILDGTNFVDWFLHKINGISWKRAKGLADKQFFNYDSSIVVSYAVLTQTSVYTTLHLIMLYFIFKFLT